MEAYLPDTGLNQICIVGYSSTETDEEGDAWYLLTNIPGKEISKGTVSINRGIPPRGVLYICNQSEEVVYREYIGLPQRVSVKVKYLRPTYQHLEDWMADRKHILCTRRGRIFITEGGNKRVFVYPESPWANPYTVKDYGLLPALALYRSYLAERLSDPQRLHDFQKLRQATQLGCFCEPGEPCHVDVILEFLKRV